MVEKEIEIFSNKLADLAGEIARKHYFKKLTSNEIESKADKSVVTEADKEIEHCIRREIQKYYPEHGILGEEENSVNLGSDYIWILDPIDGTNSFILGRPLFGILIGLLYMGKPVMGLIDQPITKERWFAVGDQQTLYNGNPVKVSRTDCIAKSRIVLSNPLAFKNKIDKVQELHDKTMVLGWEAECYSYGSLAMGNVEAVVKPGLDQYDYLPVVKVIENAGGVICGKDYAELNIDYKGDIYAAASQKVLDDTMNILK